MDVILLERIGRLGHMGDTVKVKDGYARNFLLPEGKALRANAANMKRFEAERANHEARNSERKGEASKIAETLDGKSFVFVRSAGETGQLYGSVSARDIADLIVAQGYNINRNQIALMNPIKAVGLHHLDINLHGEVSVKVSVNIARNAEEAERQAKGEKLDTAEAIYGANEHEIVPGGMDQGEFGDNE
jgi:large subunit ribosomal protein L9